MNKTIIVIALLLICVFVFGATGKRFEDGNYYKTTVYTATYSGAQTQTEAIAAVTGLSIVVDKIIFASATAGSLYLSDTTGADVDYGYVSIPANGTFIDNEVNIKFASAEAVDVTTTANTYLHLEHHYE